MDNLQPHQTRVVREREELWTKYEALVKFIDCSATYCNLPQAEKERLCRQSKLMGDYVNVLDERIAAFTA